MGLIVIGPTNACIIIAFYLLHFLSIHQTTSQPVYLYSSCEKDTVEPTSNYSTNLKTLLNSLSIKAKSSYPPGGFYSISFGSNTSEAIYGLFLCRGDQNATGCGYCVTTAAINDLPNVYCPGSQQAVIWYDECMLRYSNETLLNELATQPLGYIVGSDSHLGDPTVYANAMYRTMNDMVGDTANNKSGKKFTTKIEKVTSSIPLYALQQCTPDLKPDDCRICLKFAIDQLALFGSSRSLTPSCNVRYESFPFYIGAGNISSTLSSISATKGKSIGEKNHMILIVAILAIISVSILVVCLGSCIYKRKRKATQASKAEIDEINTVESLQFNLSTIKVATHNFSSDCKLGQGGFGEVYKGKLENGLAIAVKRLSKDSGQGVVEFKTEVVLVAKLQHKNLVKLLGFCVESTEKLLVYEFLANSSLDRFLFDATKKMSFDWQTRFKVILGVARGLLYLHEDSRLKIIHRDLKPSNILLDEYMNPKISDFGLARHFSVEETQGDTKRIVGTYGYMAPEYAITGHYSVKSDVYSFGIIILEIVSGQRNKFFGRAQHEEALLHRAWRLWNEHKALNLIDPTLSDNYSREEVEKCIHIGLLCVQGEPIDRPKMMTIVSALTGQSISIPMPKLPHLFGIDNIIDEDGEGIVTSSYMYSGTEMITNVYSRE